jgi:hypothetical protein
MKLTAPLKIFGGKEPSSFVFDDAQAEILSMLPTVDEPTIIKGKLMYFTSDGLGSIKWAFDNGTAKADFGGRMYKFTKWADDGTFEMSPITV